MLSAWLLCLSFYNPKSPINTTVGLSELNLDPTIPDEYDAELSQELEDLVGKSNQRELLVLPKGLKINSLNPDAANMIYKMIKENRVIFLDFLKRPAVVRA